MTAAELLAAAVGDLVVAAGRKRDSTTGTRVTFSPKVFIALTQLCRDRCGYCTFAQPPARLESPFLAPDEVLAIARAGVAAGCHEALFTLGEAPEDRYPVAREWLESAGYGSTVDYLVAMAGRVLSETGLLPHANAGALGAAELARLREVSASQGMMIESLNAGLDCHRGAPDKTPERRLATLEAAGALGIPFTTGILVGIGESRADRLEALEAIAASHRRHGHVQEVIVQNFRPKAGTAMHGTPPCPPEEMVWTVAVARLLLPAEVHLQAPPNLSDDLAPLLAAGIDDWGGVSPVTPDHVNPERPWPALDVLRAATEAAGYELAPRLTIYPEFALAPERWLDPAVRPPVLAASDAHGLARDLDRWHAGGDHPPPQLLPVDQTVQLHASGGHRANWSVPGAADGTGGREQTAQLHASGGHRANWSVPGAADGTAVAPDQTAQLHASGGQRANWSVAGAAEANAGREQTAQLHPSGGQRADWSARPGARGRIGEVLDGVGAGQEVGEDEIVALFGARGREVAAVAEVADDLRRTIAGDTVTWVANRNINYTNVCTFKCRFCAFSKGPLSLNLRGDPYLLGVDEIQRRVVEAVDLGATEVCLQGGIHPSFDGDYYIDVCRAVKEAAPGIHVHGFTALEVTEGAKRLGEPLVDYLRRLKDAGLATLPGTAAEILDDEVRRVLCPDKITTEEWLEAHRAAHSIGLRSNITIMFGAIEQPVSWARHLLRTRDLQKETGGFTEFVPLPFVHMATPMFLQGRSRRGPTFREALLMHAVARITYRELVPNVQVSWVKMGAVGSRQALVAGANDLGGTLIDENISRAAGASHGQRMAEDDFRRIVDPLDRPLRQRTTLYGRVERADVA